MSSTNLNEETYTASNGVTYKHTTYSCGYAIVERDGKLVEITHGDPEFDAWNECYREQMKRSWK